MNTRLVDLLDRLVELLRREGAPVVPLLRPPIDVPITIPGIVEPLVLAPSVRDLYKWHDGTTDIGGVAYCLFPRGWWFPPFNEALEYRAGRLDELEFAGVMPYWQASWFPIFRSGMNAFAVDCAPDNGQVWFSSISMVTAEVVALSVESFVAAVLTAYEQGDFSVVDGVVDMADEEQDEIDLILSHLL